MPYTPTPGVFVNGLIIDGPDIGNEFGLVASALNTQETDLTQRINNAIQEAKEYTDTSTSTVEIDGGTV